MLTFSLGALALPAGTDYAASFSAWKAKYSVSYSSAATESAAFAAFARNDDIIRETNAKGLSYWLAHNEFSGISADEFYHGRLGFGGPSLLGGPRASSAAPALNVTAAAPPAVDWVTQGAVTSVKNQGQCGSCWTFSATGAIEGAYAIATGSLVELSEEELVQCDTTDSGCGGGLMDNAFAWVEAHGLASLADYPYSSSSGTRGTCDSNAAGKKVVTISGYSDVPAGDEVSLKAAVAQQPVSIAIEADKSVFQLYKGGVLDNSACGTKLDHGVLLVGYGTDASLGKDYWKIKNSWGPTWGEDGFIRMVRGANQCGLANQASYPTGAKKAAGGGATYSYDAQRAAASVEEQP